MPSLVLASTGRTAAVALTLAMFANPATAQRRDATGDTAITVVELSPSQGKLSDLLKGEVARSTRLGRTPFVEIGAEWCGQCRELKQYASDRRMIDAFTGTYIIRLDLDAWKDQLSPLGFDVSAVPVFFTVDSTGKASGVSFTTDPLGANTPEHVAAPLQKFFHEHLRKKTA